MYRSLSAATKNIIVTESKETIVEYVMDYETKVKWPPPLYLAFLVKSNSTS
jgi:hypothetical protein